MEHAANVVREKFHGEVDKMLHEVIKFKLHIQESLESHEKLVEKERIGHDALLEG